MIVEHGRVKQVTDGHALIEIERGTACSQCHVGCVCDLEKSVMLIKARDPIGVHTDQQVEMSIENGSVLRASFVVYVIPLCALIIGVLLGDHFGPKFGLPQGVEILSGFGLLAASFLIVRWYNNIFQQQQHNQPVITNVLQDIAGEKEKGGEVHARA